MPKRLVVLPFLIACHPGELAEGVTAATVGWTVEAGKGVLHGAHEGLDRGRAGAKSVDGAEVIVDADAAHTALRWEVVGVVATPYATTVRLGVENVQDTPVRVAVLSAPDTLVIDVDGFAHRVVEAPGHALGGAVYVPPNAKVAADVTFEGTTAAVAAVRVAGVDLPWPPG